jgi:hypothetical protein
MSEPKAKLTVEDVGLALWALRQALRWISRKEYRAAELEILDAITVLEGKGDQIPPYVNGAKR